jgi:hypothetical protein
MFSRPLLATKSAPKALLPAKTDHSGDYFAAGKEKSEAGSPAFAYSLTGVRTFAEEEHPRVSPAQPALQPSPFLMQAMLLVGAVNDPLEQEADRFAEQVMGMREWGVAASAGWKRGQVGG